MYHNKKHKVMCNRKWTELKGYNGAYRVSNDGLIKSVDHVVKHSNGRHRIQKGRVLKQHVSKKGYYMVSLSLDGKRFHTSVHRLVAICFITNTDNKPQVNHKNGCKSDNYPENLEWCTNSENQIHAVKNGLVNHNKGESHHNSKLLNKEVELARRLHNDGHTNKQLSVKFNVSEPAMSKILRRETYINIK